MKDLRIRLEHTPGALAALGETLGAAGVSIEGGGAWVVAGVGEAHFLIEDEAEASAAEALRQAGLELVAVREVIVQRLDQARPGQLGALCRQMGEAGVSIEVLYSDHQHRLVLVVDEPITARAVSDRWERARLAQRGAT